MNLLPVDGVAELALSIASVAAVVAMVFGGDAWGTVGPELLGTRTEKGESFLLE